jgi:hypothetical protein
MRPTFAAWSSTRDGVRDRVRTMETKQNLGQARSRAIRDLTIRDLTREVPLDVGYGDRCRDS